KEEEQVPIPWDTDTEVRLENIPPFARPMAKAGIERYARERGYKRITLEVLADARRVYGM
ncbi:MAG: PCP reductase family protein, partial [Deltaproteobacteria bacterium]|nr:PCP reductase family protein [Deltaproteobacteria bacterium]